MLFSVSYCKSKFGGPATVTRPGFSECKNWRCEPLCRSSVHPSRLSRFSTSRTFIPDAPLTSLCQSACSYYTTTGIPIMPGDCPLRQHVLFAAGVEVVNDQRDAAQIAAVGHNAAVVAAAGHLPDYDVAGLPGGERFRGHGVGQGLAVTPKENDEVGDAAVVNIGSGPGRPQRCGYWSQ